MACEPPKCRHYPGDDVHHVNSEKNVVLPDHLLENGHMGSRSSASAAILSSRAPAKQDQDAERILSRGN
jgi:hypothetical protein